MAAQNLVTVVLALKDRGEFTARFLRSCRGLPLVIADGSREPQSWLRDEGDYFYTGYDINLAHWWFKMRSALDRVQTPYAMVAANDDFLVPHGIARCADFLEHNHDYVAASGRVEGAWVWPDKVTGPCFVRTRQYAPYDVPADYGQATANERVLQGFQNSWSYFAVYRTDALRTIWREVHDFDFRDLQLHEKFCAMRALTLGKIRCDGSFVSVVRQYGTSQGAASQAEFAQRLMRSDFSTERNRILTRMGCEGVDTAKLVQLWGDWYSAYLKREYGWKRQAMKAAKARFPKLADWVQHRHRSKLWNWRFDGVYRP